MSRTTAFWSAPILRRPVVTTEAHAISFNVTFDVSGNPIAIVTLLDQNGNYSDTSQRGQILYNYPNGTLSNGQCVINLGNSSINGGSISGNRYFNISLNMTFQSTMNGVQGVYENYSSYSSTYGQYSTNGLIWSGQNFTVGSGQPITITVSPSSATVFATRSQQFAASVSGSTAGVVWSLQGVGSVSSSGLYTAPPTITNDQAVTITASLQGNSSVSGSANATASSVHYTDPAPNVGSVYNDGVAKPFVNSFYCTGYDCRQVTCNTSYPNFSVAPSGTSIQSHGITVTAETTAQPGTATVTCTVQPLQGVAPPGTSSASASASVTILTAPPTVSGITYASGAGSTFLQGEGQVAVRINGRGLGNCGTLSVQGGSGSGVGIDNSVPSVCGGSQHITLWTPTAIEAVFSIDSTALGGYGVLVAAQTGNASGTMAVSQASVSINSIWSDQFPGVSINGLPAISGVRGAGEKTTYVLMGTRYDSSNTETAAVAGHLVVSPTFAISKLMVQLTTAGGGTGQGVGYITGNTAYVTAAPPSGIQDYQLIVGLDTNRNGRLDSNEIIARSSQTYRIVPNGTRNTILQLQSSYLLNSTSASLIPNAANLLNAFAGAIIPDGAVDPSLQTISTIAPLMINEPCLSHNVGAVFTSSGATVPQYQLLAQSSLGNSIATSRTMRAIIGTTSDLHNDEITSYFLSNPFVSDAYFGPWSLVNQSHAVIGGSDCKNADTLSRVSTEFLQVSVGNVDFDLFFAMGTVDLSGTASLHYSRNGGGSPVLDSYTLEGGTLTYDLYDFDYDATVPAPSAAEVQSGFGTLGNGGRVYKILVYLDSAVPVLLP